MVGLTVGSPPGLATTTAVVFSAGLDDVVEWVVVGCAVVEVFLGVQRALEGEPEGEGFTIGNAEAIPPDVDTERAPTASTCAAAALYKAAARL